jgi:hypothetical protein|tara:strand:+ start:1709 stop:2605 length:897 start_codon:yes stop_codon:yes gene_type:complete
MKKTNLDRLIKRVLSEKKLNLNEEKCYCSTEGSKVYVGGCNPCSLACCKEAGYDEVWSGSAVRGGTKRGKGKGMRAKLQREEESITEEMLGGPCSCPPKGGDGILNPYPEGVWSWDNNGYYCNCRGGSIAKHSPKQSTFKNKTMTVSESSLINTIEKIVKEQAAMLGFGNMGGLSLGVSKPSDKYELDEDSQDTNTSNTYNINLMNQQAANQNMEDWEMGEDYELEEDAKPDYLDFDGDGNKKESMKKALKDKEMDEQCGDGVYEGGCGERVYENVGRLLRKNIKEVQRKQLRNWIKK